jgi:uncharacterized protein YkwD
MLEIILLINSLRTEPLIVSEELNRVAEVRAIQISQDFSHDNFKSAFTGLNCSYYGENLLWGYRDNKERVNAWANSPTHYANMTFPQYKYIGIGQYGDYYATTFCDNI